jgi:hypothetical protein
MDGVVTVLEPAYYERVASIMGELKAECGVQGGFGELGARFPFGLGSA